MAALRGSGGWQGKDDGSWTWRFRTKLGDDTGQLCKTFNACWTTRSQCPILTTCSAASLKTVGSRASAFLTLGICFPQSTTSFHPPAETSLLPGAFSGLGVGWNNPFGLRRSQLAFSWLLQATPFRWVSWLWPCCSLLGFTASYALMRCWTFELRIFFWVIHKVYCRYLFPRLVDA